MCQIINYKPAIIIFIDRTLTNNLTAGRFVSFRCHITHIHSVTFFLSVERNHYFKFSIKTKTRQISIFGLNF